MAYLTVFIDFQFKIETIKNSWSLLKIVVNALHLCTSWPQKHQSAALNSRILLVQMIALWLAANKSAMCDRLRFCMAKERGREREMCTRESGCSFFSTSSYSPRIYTIQKCAKDVYRESHLHIFPISINRKESGDLNNNRRPKKKNISKTQNRKI